VTALLTVRKRCVARLAAVALLLGAASARASGVSAEPSLTRLVLHVDATTSITLTLVTDPGSCTLVNSGFDYAAVDLGSANKTSASSCAAYTAGNTYALQTTIGVETTCAGTCTRWNLSAALAGPTEKGLTWTLGTKALTTTAQPIAGNLTYGSVHGEAFRLTVKAAGPGAVATGAVQQAIDLTATANGVTGVSATATLNAEMINEPGISIFFTQDASGAPMRGGAFAAAIDFASVSEYGALPAGVTLASSTPTSYTVQTLFDVDVEQAGTSSASYTLAASLAAAAPSGLSYEIDGIPLSTFAVTITTGGTYGTQAAHALQIVISNAAPGSGGPATGTALTDTLDFTATAN
jgi:hypothetical protein